MNVAIRVGGETVEVECEPDTTVEVLVDGRPVLGMIDTHDGVLFGHWPDGENWSPLTRLLGVAT